MFNIKKDKVRYIDTETTLDIAHQKYAKKFKSQRKNLPKLKEKLTKYETKLQKLDKKKKLTQYELNEKSLLKRKIKDAKDDIYEIENSIDEINYYDLVEDPLSQYYSSFKEIEDVEDEIPYDPDMESRDNKSADTISMDDMDKIVEQHRHIYKKKKISVKRRPVEASNKKSILEYFNIDKKDKEQKKNKKSKKKFYDDFRFLIDPNFKSGKKKSVEDMVNCDCGGDKVYMNGEGVLVCSRCGEIDMIFIETDKGSHKEPIPDKPGYPYKRIDLFLTAGYPRLAVWSLGKIVEIPCLLIQTETC